MIHSEHHWRTRDGLDIYAQSWGPETGPTRAVVCLLHGLGEHSGRWAHVGAVLAQAGYLVLACDLRGHGRSEGQRGHAPSYEALLDDVALLLDKGRELAPLPQFLYGHSMGGALAINYALRRRPQLAGVIATAPWLELAMPVPGWKTQLGGLLCGVLPALAMSNGLVLTDLSHSASLVQAYASDPLVHDRISARLGVEVVAAGAWALAHAGEFTLPLLVMHGLSDRITSADASRRLATLVPGDCTFRGWEGLYHEIHNEPERDEVLSAVIAWLETRASR